MKTILVDAVHTLIGEEGGVNEPLFALLENYPNRKVILTNANDQEMIHFGFDHAPYKVFTLKHAPDKTDPSYYSIMLKFFEFKSEDVVYIEHHPDAVANAEATGITTYFYDPARPDFDDLKSFLDTHLA